jgi:hypothetical protein
MLAARVISSRQVSAFAQTSSKRTAATISRFASQHANHGSSSSFYQPALAAAAGLAVVATIVAQDRAEVRMSGSRESKRFTISILIWLLMHVTTNLIFYHRTTRHTASSVESRSNKLSRKRKTSLERTGTRIICAVIYVRSQLHFLSLIHLFTP